MIKDVEYKIKTTENIKEAYCVNRMVETSRISKSTKMKSVKILTPQDVHGIIYYFPTPKSPHGVDVDPSGEYIVVGCKLAAVIPVHSFSKLQKAIADKAKSAGIEQVAFDRSGCRYHGRIKALAETAREQGLTI